VRGDRRRRLHKAFLRYHDANNWPLLREALSEMGRADLIGNGKHHLIPTYQPTTDGSYQSARRKNSTPVGVKTSVVKPAAKAVFKGVGTKAASDKRIVVPGRIQTQHTGLPPRVTGAKVAPKKGR